MATIPPGGTVLDTFKRSFTDVPVDADGNVSTVEFLEAAESLTGMFDIIGPVAFSVVKKDILGNVAKLHARYTAAPEESTTIQALVANELKTGKHVATEGGLWLVRGLDFTCQALSRSLEKPSEELATSFREAYSKTLSKHHGILVKPVFSAAMSACPYRATFFKQLGDDPAKVEDQFNKYLQALTRIVEILNPLFEEKKKSGWK